MFLPMEVLISKKEIDVVQLSILTEIPSLSIVTQAIIMLCKEEEKISSDTFVYIKFPFGALNLTGLRDLQKYHQYLTRMKQKKQCNVWLSKCEGISNDLGIDINKIKEHFSSSESLLQNQPSLVSVTSDQWITEIDLGKMFHILNKDYNDTLCLICTPDKYIDEAVKLKGNQNQINRILVALNVGRDATSGSVFITDGVRVGNHWTLLAFDTINKVAYYGDSLSWAIPDNLKNMVGPLLRPLKNFDINNYSVSPINVSPCGNRQQCISNSELFYPLQTCSDMCGVIVMCMATVMCETWNNWLCWSNDYAPKFLSNPSKYSKHLRLTILSWLVANKVNVNNLMGHEQPPMDGGTKLSEADRGAVHTTDHKQLPGEGETEQGALHATDPKQLPAEGDTEQGAVHTTDSNQGEGETEHGDDTSVHASDDSEIDELLVQKSIVNMLPSNYDYKFNEVNGTDNDFSCSFKIKLKTEEEARTWISDYNKITHETMVYERNKKQMGKRVLRKLYLRCQHNQRQTGKHTKSDRQLKTTHKQHNLKHTNCPAKFTLTILVPHKRHSGYLVEVSMKHIHNHLVEVADALRFRPISADTKAKYYDLFKQGHSPASAHLERETNLLYSDDPQLLADRNINPKLSDVYNLFNKWRKTNLGVRTGKQLFTDLEKRVNVYNVEHKEDGGRAVIQRFCKKESKSDDDQPLVLAICTPLMARVHKHIQQSCELVFIDSSSSFEDFNNPIFVISTSSAAGGLPLGVVVTSGESASIIHTCMTKLKEIFPECSFYGQGSPATIITDDSSAEREGLQKTWPDSTLYLCVFHFLQSMWRWLLCSNNNIGRDDRQCLMGQVRKLVYAKTEDELNDEYKLLQKNSVTLTHQNFITYLNGYWKRRHEWAVCFRNCTKTRGINTNNYAEAGIRILKDIVFKRIKAYNLLQVFEFLTVTFEMYYERRLLAVAYNRMDRYISLRYKGLGASKVDNQDISKPEGSDYIYYVNSKTYDIQYSVDCQKWTCTCSIGRTGHPSGEPCKHQHAVAKKYNINAPNLLPYFNSKGRHLHAIIALGTDKAGTETFYLNLKEKDMVKEPSAKPSANSNELQDCTNAESNDSGAENLDLMVDLIQEHNGLKIDVTQLCNSFVTDIEERMEKMDIQYLLGLKKFFTIYMEAIRTTEPTTSATPKLTSLLHTYFSKDKHRVQTAGSRRISVQPTAIARRRAGISRGNNMAVSGRPVKRPHPETDSNIQSKRGRMEHTKRKQNLKQNEQKNQANHLKHGRGH